MLRRLVTGVVGTGLLLAAILPSAMAQQSYIIVNDEKSVKDLIPKLSSGEGVATLETADVYKDDREGKAAIKVTGAGGDGQKFNPNIPDWIFKIVAKPDPKKADEMRYITWAWKKVGGTGIQLQISGQGDWGHRYHSGANEKGWNPSIEVNPKLDTEWTVYTRDLFTDWNAFTMTGIALTAWSLPHGIWDHMVLHQTEDDPIAALAVDPKSKLPVAWGRLKENR